MRTLIAILIALVVPLQSAWAMASAYCAHEAGAASGHIGHHAHEHESEAGDVVPAQDGAVQHPDCGYCHTATVATLSDAGLTTLEVSRSGVQAPDSGVHPIIHSSRPERPKWLRRS